MDKNRFVPAISKAASAVFKKDDWLNIGYETNLKDIIASSRLLRDLQWGNVEYDGSVIETIELIFDSSDDNARILLNNEKIKRWIKKNDSSFYSDFYDKDYVAPFQQNIDSPCEVVKKALNDTEILLSSANPVSAVDRVYTALHGYLMSILDEKDIEYKEESSITVLYKGIRTNVYPFNELAKGSPEIDRLLKSFSSIIDPLIPIRNNNSLAHPNEELIGKHEAILVINVVRTILHYLDAKLTKNS